MALLVGVTLLSTILIPLFMLFQSSRQSTVRSLNAITASQLIATQMEKLRSLPFKHLEEFILGSTMPLPGEDDDDFFDDENRADPLLGPFEFDPETPDIVEEDIFVQGDVHFTRLTYIAYFPRGNPDPRALDIFQGRQRIRIRVAVFWEEPGPAGKRVPRKLAMSTMVHNEHYHPKPIYVR